MKTRARFAPPFLLAWALLLSAGASFALAAPSWDFPATARTVSFADVHGAYDELLTLLQEAGIVDTEGNWAGGDTRLVSTGDLLDRGPDSRKVLDLLMRLQQQAPASGGSVHLALGNHELMVLVGDMRYVSAGEYAAFAAEESPAEREALFADFAARNPGAAAAALRAEFDRTHPPGYGALRRAFGPEGHYGRWLIDQPVVLKIGDTLYLHGGVSSAITNQSLEELNTRFAAELREYLALVEELTRAGVLPATLVPSQRAAWLTRAREAWSAANGKRAEPPWAASAARLVALDRSALFDSPGPLWYRGTALCHPAVAGFDVERALVRWQARRMVIGHTPTPSSRVTARFGGQVLLADTGMLGSVYKGRAAAVVIEGTTVKVRYAGEPDPAEPVADEVKVPRQPPGMDDAAVEDFLRTAPIVASRAVGTGVTKPLRLTLARDGQSLDAIYKNVDSDRGLQSGMRYEDPQDHDLDRYGNDIAAYRLDRALGLNRVPLPVERKVNGKSGLVQLWVSGTVNETERAARGEPWSGACAQHDEYRLRVLFDLLIYNEDRNLGNLLWTDDDFTLVLIDHSRAFRAVRKRAPQYRKSVPELSEAMRERLAGLDRATLDPLLGEYLHAKQIEAILARRDMILREAQPTGFVP